MPLGTFTMDIRVPDPGNPAWYGDHPRRWVPGQEPTNGEVTVSIVIPADAGARHVIAIEAALVNAGFQSLCGSLS